MQTENTQFHGVTQKAGDTALIHRTSKHFPIFIQQKQAIKQSYPLFHPQTASTAWISTKISIIHFTAQEQKSQVQIHSI